MKSKNVSLFFIIVRSLLEQVTVCHKGNFVKGLEKIPETLKSGILFVNLYGNLWRLKMI